MSNAMEAVTNKVLRGEVLNIVCGAEPYGASMETVTVFLKEKGYAVDKNDAVILTRYLAGKGLAEITEKGNKVLNLVMITAHITPKGVDVLEGTVTVEGVELPN